MGNNNRLHALDGIRGLAILLVVLTHVSTAYISPVIPTKLAEILFSSGITGVSMLFVLSGFLMTTIYPNPSNSFAFLQKRYTRIFPLFITMCFVMFILRLFPKTFWYQILGVLLLFSLITHFIWVYGIKKVASKQLNKSIFMGFILLQVVMGFLYAFWIVKFPPIVFNQQIPPFIREGTIGLVNATLTLPFGNYIPMLDGVYWSLAAEILFYILYPFVCVPLVRFFALQKKWIKIFLLLSLIPFFAGLDLLSHKILLLSMLQLPLCFYFVTGIVLGFLYLHQRESFKKIYRLFPSFLYIGSILFFILVIVLKIYALDFFPRIDSAWVHILGAFPLTFALSLGLDEKTALSKLLSKKPFIFLGTISYSIYLSHSVIIHMIESVYKPVSLITNIGEIVVIFFFIIAIASILFFLLEKPYFQRKKEVVKEKSSVIDSRKFFAKNPAFILASICCIYIAGIFFAYQSNFNFFSSQTVLDSSVFVLPKISSQKLVSMFANPLVRLEFTSTQDNLAVITMHLMRKIMSHAPSYSQQLLFRIKEESQKNWLVTNAYIVKEVGNSLYHPFGFPIIAKAKNHKFIVELSMSYPKAAEYIAIDPLSVRAVYKMDKLSLLKNPLQLLSLLFARISNVFENHEAQDVLLLFIPFCLLCLLVYSNKKKYTP